LHDRFVEKARTMKLIQIIPQLPPAINGLGDYALNLASQLRQDYNIQTHFIVCDRTYSSDKSIDDFPISQLSNSTAEALLSMLSQQQIDTVLLHYVGYGYAQRGCPVWLVEGLEQWQTKSDRRQLITMFHEVYASSNKPWHSSFWLSPWQKNVAGRLVKISDRILTSKQLYANILTDLSQGKHRQINAIPVFSTLGEPQQILPLSKRQPWLVIFGGSNNRRRAYLKSRTKIISVCEIFGVEKIIDVGISTELSLSNLDGIPIKEMGKLSINQIQEIFLNCYGGFLDYNPDFLAKSTIFAAYCAYGMLPISANFSDFSIDGIDPGRHYWMAGEHTSEKNLKQVQAIANNAHVWYQSHNLSSQAQIFASHISHKHQLKLK
jgi:hypothetical protein